jgi:NADPH:quinone reductase-like Zn-dependent oxidoreductase
MKAITVENTGAGYKLVLTELKTSEPQPGEVLIKVAAAGLNRADLIQAMGGYPPPPGAPSTLGLEVSGEIAALGAGVRSLKIGDKVCALLGGGGYAEFCAV